MDTRRNSSGFTITELMVALAVMILVMSQVMYAYTNQHTKSKEHERLVENQSEVRLVTDVILNDLRMAGFMVHETASIGSIDGGTTGSDTLCVSDPNAIDDAVVDNASVRLTGAKLTTAVTAGDTSLTLLASSMDIDEDGDVDFVDGAGVLISGGDKVHCGRITGVGSSSITFTPALPGGFSITPSEGIIVPALTYEVNGTELSRNGMVLSDQVEDLQVEFGVDVDSNGLVEGAEFPIHDLTGQDLNLVRTARIHVTGRTSRGVEGFAGQFAAVANRNAGTADDFKRRRVTADATLRNMR
jgi:Tfp pilus assembly protein PilW